MRKNQKQYVTLICENENCKKEFVRPLKEYKRCQKKGYSIACSRSCGMFISNKKYPREKHIDKLTSGYEIWIANKYGKHNVHSPFRYFLRSINGRTSNNRYLENNLSIEDLEEVYKSQLGKCPYTGYKMKLPNKARGYRICSPFQASLDRIDSSKGYIKGNIEFVCLAINYAKNSFTKEKMINFISNIPLYHKK